ncbi:uncharacterized protein METZ01_LOCUS3756 [marine metagenome]|uniref:CoA transferase n=1 Tax=marine metagenome TaxID=408172 RepID=A0A381N8G4_9ZZZZ
MPEESPRINLLDGVRVLDFTHVHAGPLCTYQLALMGADIIKVEAPGNGDQMRSMGQQLAPGMSPGFLGQNASKRSIALNLKTDDGVRVVHRLMEDADVVVINMRPGTADRIGIGYETARTVNPSIVYCAISGYGQEGPEADRPAMDHLIQGESGMFMATGTEDQPVRVGFAIADAGTAVIASSAILGALVRKGREGSGAFLDVSMLESCMALMGLNYYNFFATGKVGPRVGPNPLAQIGSAGTWKTKDGVLLVNANNQRLFERMARALGRGDLLEDDRFRDLNASGKHRDELRAILGEIFSTDTANHWDGVLRKAGVPSGQLKNLDDVVENPQLKFRNTLTTMSDVPGIDEALTFLGAGFTVDETPTRPTTVPPTLGRDSDDILTEIGINRLEIKRLRKIGVIA